MAKKLLQDVVLKKSIRNISVPKRTRIREEKEEKQEEERELLEESEDIIEKRYGMHYSRYSKFFLWSIAVISIIALIFSIISIFSGVNLELKPKVVPITLDNIQFDSNVSSSSALPFTILKVDSKSMGQVVAASIDVPVQTKASGTATVYNETTLDQVLIATTRFADPNGLVFRTSKKILVPAGKNVNGVITPGQVDVLLSADKIGDNYNIASSTFRIPGFSGDKVKYSKMYAKSKTGFTGGANGKTKKIDDKVLSLAKTDLHAGLKDALLKALTDAVPTDSVLYDGSTFIYYESLPQTNVTASNVTVNEKGTISGIIFNKEKLSEAIASKSGKLNLGETVMGTDLDKLTFSLKTKNIVDLDNSQAVSFTLTGKTNMIWQIDIDKVKSDLVGKSKSDMSNILSKYSSIAEANATFMPFWSTIFPMETNKIDVKILDVTK